MSNYVIWKYAAYPAGCSLQNITGFEETYLLKNGTSLAKGFPSDVAFHMHPDYPDDLALGDSLLNLDSLVIGSTRLKDFLSARDIPELEFLPVRIVDHKGRSASEDYFVVHPTAPIDCLDRENSAYKMSSVDPNSFRKITRLVLDESRIPEDRQIFNMACYWDLTFVRRDLAQAIAAQGFSGIRWIELQEHPES